MPPMLARRPGGTLAIRTLRRCDRSSLSLAAHRCASLRRSALVAGRRPHRHDADAAVPGPPVARGSVEQVAITGATPGTALQLVDPDRARPCARDRPTHRRAPLPRTCHPAHGYRVEEPGGARTRAPVRVPAPRTSTPPHALLRVPAPRSRATSTSRTRDGTQLAVNVRLPGPPDDGPVPDRRRVLRLRPGEPRRQPGRDARSRRSLGLRDRRREHARHRLLGRRVATTSSRCRRSTATTRSRSIAAPAVGRARQGRDGRHLVLRASRSCSSPRPAAAPRGHHAAVGDRRHLPRRPLPRRDPQHRVRGAVGRGPSVRRRARAGGRPGLGEAARRRRATRRAPPTRRCGCRPRDVLAEIRRRTRSTTRPARPAATPTNASSTGSTCPTFLAGAWQDEQTGGHWPAMIDHFAPGVAAEGDDHQRHARRAVRPRRDHTLGRVPRLLRRPPGAAHPRRRRAPTRPPATPR